jgi:hypothetical protein
MLNRTETIMSENLVQSKMTQVTSEIWIIDDRPIQVAGLPIPVRMTVVRLTGGGLLLHSPTRYSDDLRAKLEQIGPIQFLLAPSVAHWIFLHDWQKTNCPE